MKYINWKFVVWSVIIESLLFLWLCLTAWMAIYPETVFTFNRIATLIGLTPVIIFLQVLCTYLIQTCQIYSWKK